MYIKMMFLKKSATGFTLIEILVVCTIISLLVAGGVASYAQFGKQSRDARRKADIEQIRAALELYRSNSATSSYPLTLEALEPLYLQDEVLDPKTKLPYTYTPLTSANGTCPAETTPCTSYSVKSPDFESGTYNANPYGGFFLTSTPAP